MDDKPKCPECGSDLFYIRNNNLSGQFETLPLCDKCRKAFRLASLGWKMDADEGGKVFDGR